MKFVVCVLSGLIGISLLAKAQNADLHFCNSIRANGTIIEEDTVFKLPPGGGYVTFVVRATYNNWANSWDTLNGHSIKYYICCDKGHPAANSLGYMVYEQSIRVNDIWSSTQVTFIHPGSYFVSVYRDDKFLCCGWVRVEF